MIRGHGSHGEDEDESQRWRCEVKVRVEVRWRAVISGGVKNAEFTVEIQ